MVAAPTDRSSGMSGEHKDHDPPLFPYKRSQVPNRACSLRSGSYWAIATVWQQKNPDLGHADYLQQVKTLVGIIPGATSTDRP